MMWHASWLEEAIKKSKETGSGIDGDMTITEFINKYIPDQVASIVKVED